MPAQAVVDVRVSRRFRLAGRVAIEPLVEAFNLFNRTVFGTGSTSLDSATLGLVTNQVNTPRQMQAGLKVYW